MVYTNVAKSAKKDAHSPDFVTFASLV